jgi:hypothetical protein
LEITCCFELLRSSIYRRPYFCTQCGYLLKEDEEEWLNPDIVEPERLLPLLKQYPDTEMEAYPVSTALNRPNNDTAEITQTHSATQVRPYLRTIFFCHGAVER